jgi:hypothetical protein
MRRIVLNVMLWAFMATLLGLTGCGGGGGGDAVVSGVSGVAAVGVPLVGTAYLKDSATPAKELMDTIASDGSFAFNVDGLTPPFILKAQGTAAGTSYTLYSFASGSGIANINPIGNVAVANAVGSSNLAAIYATPVTATMQLIDKNIGKAIADIQAHLQLLFVPYNATSNPISGIYMVNHLGLDGVLDMVKVSISGTGTVTLTNKLTNAVICTGPVAAISSWTTPTHIPLPPLVVNVSPGTATVNTNGSVVFTVAVSNATNTQVRWSIDESGGGTITSTGTYTAPATIGIASVRTYTVRATSIADPTKSDTALVTVSTGPIVTITPTSTTVITNGTKTFSATVTNSSNTQVIWSVLEADGGTISQSGVYTAPVTVGTYHVRATSAADTTKYATATITITSVGLTINPHLPR